MKFCDKYPQLKDKDYLARLLVNTVFSTMELENQNVAFAKVEEIVWKLLREEELKGREFITDQAA